ncbi:hypothetical protein AVEN_270868-1, partial [Araneus ventricosus]
KSNPYDACLLSAVRTSPPLKRRDPPQTGLRRCESETFRPAGTA